MQKNDTEELYTREELVAEIERLNAEIRRRLIALVEHPGVSDDFKNDPKVREWVK
jgi:hypothetical protein